MNQVKEKVASIWDLKENQDGVLNESVFDCMVAENLLSDGRSIPQLGEALIKYDVQTIEELAKKQAELLAKNQKLNKLFSEIEMPLVYVLSSMERQGIMIDSARLTNVRKELSIALESLKKEILEKVGSEINLASPAQVGLYLAEHEMVPLPKTKSGQYATGEMELLKYAKL